MSTPAENRWPGERLGLPQAGPCSVGRLGRRILALAIDWALAYLISLAFFSAAPWQTDPFITLGLFAAEQTVFLWIFAGSAGHLVCGLRVVPLQPGWIGWWRPIVRTLLLCLFIPAVIWDRDQRGLHDLAAGTVLVRA